MNIAVSACLLGEPCRYDGASKPNSEVLALTKKHTLVPICPEVMGGLSTPRAANEIQTVQNKLCVMDKNGCDNTQAFVKGANEALTIINKTPCQMAILKAKSPSCGIGKIYDGTFTRTLTEGNGVAASVLINAGIPVATEKNFASELGL